MNNRARRRLSLTLLAALGAVLVALPSAAQSTPPEATCAATPLEDRLPSIIAPMAGQHPVWLVGGSFGRWYGSTELVKSVWVLARDVPGDLVLRGHQRDGDGILRFQDGVDASPVDTLVVAGPNRRSVVPGGASREIMQDYAFYPMYLIYPSPGCWEVNARLGDEEVQIVVELK